MRRITFAIMGTFTAVVALFSYHTSTNSTTAGAVAPATAANPDTSSGANQSGAGQSPAAVAPTDSSSASSGSGSSGSGSSGSSSSGSSSSGTFTGDEADTQWGVVQVAITVDNGKITKAEAVEYPSQNPRDQEINSYAVPALNSEVVKSQSSSIDAISGATVTSGGYIQSLQSAIDKANL